MEYGIGIFNEKYGNTSIVPSLMMVVHYKNNSKYLLTKYSCEQHDHIL